MGELSFSVTTDRDATASGKNIWGILCVSWATYLCSIWFWWGCFTLSEFLLSSFACSEYKHPHCAGGEDFTMCLKFERDESSPFTGFYGIVSQWQVYGKSAKNGVEVLQIFWIYIQENKGRRKFKFLPVIWRGKFRRNSDE